VHRVRLELLAPAERRELHQKRAGRDIPAEPADQIGKRVCGAARRQQVIVNQDAGAARKRVGVNLERVEPILERVLRADRVARQLSALARRDEPRLQASGKRAAENEATRLRSNDEVNLEVSGELRQPRDRGIECPRVEQQWVMSLNMIPS